MKLALLGYGRMGHEVEVAARARDHEVAVALDVDNNAGGAGIVEETFRGVDAAIDFSHADAVYDNLDGATRLGVPLVIGTTGWNDRIDELRALAEERDGAVVYAANFSVGANLFFRLVDHAVRLFEPFEDYDPYVFEHHHRDKVDAPSGTALRLARLVTAASSRKQSVQAGNPEGAIARDALHVASLRAGAAFGEHVVGFDGSADTIKLEHVARGRQGFARGAVLAAEWIVGRRGFFAFDAVLDDIGAGAVDRD
ncbi:MAG: 4-hydroxy-tetrahydrodipicolinate reductase [Acidobacteriota bacterium]